MEIHRLKPALLLLLKSASASTAHTAARTAPSTEARTATAARRGGHYRTCAHCHIVQAADEQERIETATGEAALIPRWRLSIDIFECADPLLFHAQSHGVGQKLLKRFRRLCDPIHIIALDVRQKILKTQPPGEGFRAHRRARRHEPAESGNDPSTKNS